MQATEVVGKQDIAEERPEEGERGYQQGRKLLLDGYSSQHSHFQVEEVEGFNEELCVLTGPWHTNTYYLFIFLYCKY